MKFLAVDLGASSGRTIVGDVDAGSIRLTETHRFANGATDVGDEKHWAIDTIVGNVRDGIAKSGPVSGIGVDTWGVDYGLLGRDGQLLDDPFSYRDLRTEAVIPTVRQRVGGAARLYAVSGLQHMWFNTVYQVTADLEARPDLLARAERLVFMPQLISYLLSGTPGVEYTIASTSGLLDARTRDWSTEIIDAIGLPRRIFGDIQRPGTTLGDYHGTPIYLVGSHDTASAVASVPITTAGNWAYISSGTWSLVGAELDQPCLSAAAATAGFTNEGGVDGSIRFLKNVAGLWLIQECRRLWAESGTELSFAEIAAEAEAATHFAAIVDPNDPRYAAPENMIETIAGHCLETGQPAPQTVGEFARCIYVSLAQAYRRVLAELAEVSGRKLDRIHVVGGGCNVGLLNQLTADYCGVPVYAGPVEATAIGNICAQAMANGLFADLAACRRAVAEAFEITVYEPRGS